MDYGYAEVCVNATAAQRRTLSYAIPPYLQVVAGQAVLVPFGAKILQGIVLKLTDTPAVEETKDIAGIIEPRPLLTAQQVELAYWLSDYYLTPIFDAVSLMLPPGFERKVQTFVSAQIPDGFAVASLSPDEDRLLEPVRQQAKPVGVKRLETLFGKAKAQRLIMQLVRKQLLVRSYELEPIKVKPQTNFFLGLAVTTDQARQEIAGLRSKRATKQAELLEFLTKYPGQIALSAVRQKLNCRKSVADVLAGKGLIDIQRLVSRRDPLAHWKTVPSTPLSLTGDQTSVLRELKSSLANTAGRYGSSEVFLLHGVTGSGKTEIYLQGLAEAVRSGKRGIALVPEIALTPQTIERFSARFPGRVAVLHSQLSLGERFDEWHRIQSGAVDVVVGARSALFAPQPDLGVVIIDEEHEWNYKQSDQSPYYHARNTAIKLADLHGAVVILGSATPDVETYYHARKGDYRLLELSERLPTDKASLPRVEVVDMREELKMGNRGLFSRALSKAINDALSIGGQTILFLNRRGAATFMQCRRCGFSLRCKRCDVPLTYHSVENYLICHQCNYRTRSLDACPRCQSRHIKFLGVGTEKLEQETAGAFPGARLLRWDSDTTQRRHSHQAILDEFRAHRADILIGTQMVSKGLDMPQVTLVGIINADTGLNLPDFRAGERTFQLLSQVAGRAGRGPLGGQVIIQTYSPDHYAVKAAEKHDYLYFYGREIEYRRVLRQPPFAMFARMTYSHKNDILCRQEAERVAHVLISEKEAHGLNVDVLGPAPAFIRRRRGHFRWQLVLRGSNLQNFLSEIDVPPGWKIDIDPIGLS